VNSVTYRLVMFRPVAITVFSVLSLVAVALIREVFSSHDPILVVFIVLWLAALVWNGYWFLFRIAYEIGVIDGSTLRWRTMLATHEALLTRVKGVKTPFGPFGAGRRMIIVEGATSPMLLASRGFDEVAAMIARHRPDLSISTSWYDRAAVRFSNTGIQWRRLGGGAGS